MAILTPLGAPTQTVTTGTYGRSVKAFTVGERWRMESTPDAQWHIEAARAKREAMQERYQICRDTPREALYGLEFGRVLALGPGRSAKAIRVECSCGHLFHCDVRGLLRGVVTRCSDCTGRYLATYGRRPDIEPIGRAALAAMQAERDTREAEALAGF